MKRLYLASACVISIIISLIFGFNVAYAQGFTVSPGNFYDGGSDNSGEDYYFSFLTDVQADDGTFLNVVPHIGSNTTSYYFSNASVATIMNNVSGGSVVDGVDEAAAKWGFTMGTRNLSLTTTDSSSAVLKIHYDPYLNTQYYADAGQSRIVDTLTGEYINAEIILGSAVNSLTHEQRVRVLAHELGHFAFGLADLYNVPTNSAIMYWNYGTSLIDNLQGTYTQMPTSHDLNGMYIANGLNWYQTTNGWKNWNSDGSFASGWKTIGSADYYFNSTTNIRHTGWLTLSGAKYCFDLDGIKQIGLVQVGSFKYYFAPEAGIMQTGWVQFSEGKRYFNAITESGTFDGMMQTGLKQIGSSTYYFDTLGIMQTGWVTIGTWHYYFNDEGVRMPGYSWQESVPGSGGGGGGTIPSVGSFSLTSSATVEQGQQIDLWWNDYISDVNIVPADAMAWHFDFGVADPNHEGGYGPSDGFISIDKHTGILTGLAENGCEPSIVYVFMTPLCAPFGNPSNPCYMPLFDVQEIEVTVTAPTDYGYQGLDNALYMNSPTVQSSEGNATDGYVNNLGYLVPDEDNNLHFEYTQLAGFDYILPTTYASTDYNGQNLILTDSNGMMVRRLEWPISPESSIIIGAYHTEYPKYKTVELMININNLPPGNYRLQFYGGFKGEDDDGPRTLGAPVTFAFSI